MTLKHCDGGAHEISAPMLRCRLRSKHLREIVAKRIGKLKVVAKCRIEAPLKLRLSLHDS